MIAVFKTWLATSDNVTCEGSSVCNYLASNQIFVFGGAEALVHISTTGDHVRRLRTRQMHRRSLALLSGELRAFGIDLVIVSEGEERD